MGLPFLTNRSLDHLPTYQPGRPIEEVAREHGLPVREIIKLASNENPLGPSPAAIAAIQQAVSQLHLYPDGSAFYLKQKLAERLGVEPTHLILGNGSNEIIEFLGHACMKPRTNIVVSQYCFAIYPIIAKMFGAEVITVPARNYGHDLFAMLDAITPETTLLFVANPNNPTGTLASRADLVKFLNEIPNHVLLAMDEAYIEFLDDPVDLLPLVRLGFKPNLILLRTFSKIHGLAGLRLGYGIGHPELIATLEKVRQPFNINSLVQAGALAALFDHEHIRRTRTNNAQGLHLFHQTFNEMGLDYVPSSANFVLVRVGNGIKVFTELQKLGIITRPMGGYDLPEWIRVSVGTPAENARCIEALRKILETETLANKAA
ncbi:MAG: histidinol-phosphate transaminase [Verrucomicrobiota bacterium]|nr:histidinol-phosphate transaminase [Verrucomicrobiota bacterium]